MQELLPVGFGAVVGVLVWLIDAARIRAVVFPIACVSAGVAASAINGELHEGWLVFVSFDSLLAWAGAILTASVVFGVRRLRVSR